MIKKVISIFLLLFFISNVYSLDPINMISLDKVYLTKVTGVTKESTTFYYPDTPTYTVNLNGRLTNDQNIPRNIVMDYNFYNETGAFVFSGTDSLSIGAKQTTIWTANSIFVPGTIITAPGRYKIVLKASVSGIVDPEQRDNIRTNHFTMLEKQRTITVPDNNLLLILLSGLFVYFGVAFSSRRK